MGRTKFEATPLLVENSLILCTPFNEVIALDPETGSQKWRFDPKVSNNLRPANRYNCRGVTYWVDQAAPVAEACRSRIFTGTNDMRVIALDARTGTPCAGFGDGGEVNLDPGIRLDWPREMQINSPPVVARDVLIVGSSIADNRRSGAPRGTVRALDARTGVPRWTWEPLIDHGIDAGAANVWAPMSVDEQQGLVFLPTSSPSPDFWGGKGRATMSMPIRWWRCAPRPVNWSGPFRPCITTCGIMICRPSRRLPASIPAMGIVTSFSGDQTRIPVRARRGDGPADLAGRGAPGAAGRSRARAAFCDAAIPDPPAGTGAAAHLGGRCVRPDQPRRLP
jgi:hypothetical protein